MHKNMFEIGNTIFEESNGIPMLGQVGITIILVI
jgi:hypothetical protein